MSLAGTASSPRRRPSFSVLGASVQLWVQDSWHLAPHSRSTAAQGLLLLLWGAGRGAGARGRGGERGPTGGWGLAPGAEQPEVAIKVTLCCPPPAPPPACCQALSAPDRSAHPERCWGAWCVVQGVKIACSAGFRGLNPASWCVWCFRQGWRHVCAKKTLFLPFGNQCAAMGAGQLAPCIEQRINSSTGAAAAAAFGLGVETEPPEVASSVKGGPFGAVYGVKG